MSTASRSLAMSVLEYHCSDDEGLLSRLRPYRGFDHHILDELRQALLELISSVDANGGVTVKNLDVIYTLIWTVRATALEDDGMLVRNNLIDTEEKVLLSHWIRDMERMFVKLLGMLADKDEAR